MKAISGKSKARPRALAAVLVLIVFSAGHASPSLSDESEWRRVLDKARGKTVDWHMYGGFPAANAYVNGYVARRVEELYGIKVRQVPVTDVSEVVSKLLVEKQAGKDRGGSVDLIWINGENFRTAKRHGLLHGPFANKLPNNRLINWEAKSMARDFGEPVGGMESPWGSAQMVMVHDAKRTPEPPRSMAALLKWTRRRPGRFTYPAPPDFTGSVFIRHVFYHVSGEVDYWQGDIDRARLDSASAKLYKTLADLGPHLWRGGSTYPESPIRQGQMLADGEVDLSMTYHPAEPSKLILDGVYPDTVRTYVFEEGTIANTHFVAIPMNAADKEAAMVVANFLISPEAQLQKADPRVWGDLPAIDQGRLDPEWKQKFMEQERGPATLSDKELKSRRLPELPSDILVALEKGWQEKVLKGR